MTLDRSTKRATPTLSGDRTSADWAVDAAVIAELARLAELGVGDLRKLLQGGSASEVSALKLPATEALVQLVTVGRALIRIKELAEQYKSAHLGKESNSHSSFHPSARLSHLSIDEFGRVCDLVTGMISTLSKRGYTGREKRPEADPAITAAIKEVFKIVDVNQERFSELFGKTSSNISRWLNGKTEPDVRNLEVFLDQHCRIKPD